MTARLRPALLTAARHPLARLPLLALLAMVLAPAAHASISGSPSPNTGDYSVSWTAVPGTDDGYRLQESTNGGSTWSTTYVAFSTSRAFSGKSPATYTYRVKSCKLVYRWGEWLPECSLSGYGNVSVIVNEPIPNKPSAITGPSSDYDGAFSISWGSSAGADSYQLQRKLNSGSWSTIQNTSATGRSESGLAAGSWNYRVRACNGTGCSSYTSTKTVVVTLPPSTPSAITGPASDANGSYTISWGSVSSATSYTLQRKINGGSWSTIQNTSATSRSESGLGDGSYTYRVKACNAAGCSSYTGNKSVIVLFPPGPAGNISGPSTDTDGSYTLTWATVASATTFELQRQVDGGSWTTIQDASSTSRSESGLGNGAYGYRVRGCNSSGCGGYGGTKTVTVSLPPPTPGAISGPSADYDGDYSLSWGASSTADSYELQRQSDGGIFTTIQTSASLNRDETGMIAADYGYKVRACNASGCGSYTAVKTVAVITAPDSPGTIDGPWSDSDGEFALSWGAATYADTYQLEQRVDGGAWSTVQNTSNTTYAASSLAVASYEYRVAACNAAGCSPFTPTKEVVVFDPPASASGNEDSYPTPGSFSPPAAGDFPDAAIVVPSDPLHDKNVGALAGNGGVSGGQASYSIPIVVPPGRKSIQPSVSLTYSSSGGNGVIGVGWSLSANSAVTRCAATPAQDGYTTAVQYDATRDRLCLDGQRLVVATGVYGSSGATYRTELDSFTRVTQYGGINGTSTYFIAEYKNGLRRWFGSTPDARFVAEGRTETLTWAESEARDRSENTMLFDYQDFGNGEYHLSAIHYTGHNGSQGDRHVRFDYEYNEHPRSFYMAGGKTRLTRRLAAIRTEYQSVLVRSYTLNYSPSQYSSRNLLRSVQECAEESPGNPRCFPATDFEWQESAQTFVTEQLQFFNNGNPTVYLDQLQRLDEIVPRGDANGDGVKDWEGVQVNAEGEVASEDATDLANCFKQANILTLTCLDADFDADGRTDAFRRNNNVLEIRFADSSTWLSTGIAWATGSIPALGDAPIGFADFNGDGWVDLAMKTDSKLYVYFHTKNLNAPFSSTSKQLVHTFTSQNNMHTTDVQIYGDMDGNGTPDFVVSNTSDSTDPPGLPTPTQIILTHSQTGGGMTTTTRSVPTYFVSGGGGTFAVDANFFHDVNGDGLQDVVSMKETGELQFKVNTGTGFGASWVGLGVSIPVRDILYEPTPNEYAVAKYPVMSKLLVMDYDGDGRPEMLTAGSIEAGSCTYIQQAQPAGPDWFCGEELYETYQVTQYAAVGQAINASTLDNSVRTYDATQFTENLSGNVSATTFPTGIVASASQTAVVDATGDGLPDVVTAFGCRYDSACEFNNSTVSGEGLPTNASYSATGAWINRNLGTATDNPANAEFEYAGYDLMSAVQDAFGNRHEWTYKPLSSDAYDKTSSGFYEVTHDYQAGNPDYFHFSSSMYVVAEHKASNGIGGLNSSLYRYRGAIYNNKGRGFQGFKTIIVEEDVYDSGHALADTDKVTRTDFHQMWPTSSIIEQSCTFLAEDDALDDNPGCSGVLSLTSVDVIHDVATTGGARFVAVKTQTETSYDLDANPNLRTLLTTKVTDRTFDAAGNVTAESRTHTDDWGTYETTTSRPVSIDWTNWWLNKLLSSEVTTDPVTGRHASSPYVAPGQDATKIVTKSFTEYDTTKRLPKIVSVTGNDTAITSTVTTNYNAYGLPISISTTGTGISTARTVSTTYSNDGVTQSDDGYFPFTITNALQHQATIHTDPKHGKPVSQWDANGQLTTTVRDAFGRESDVTTPGAPTQSIRYRWCDGGLSCTALAVYRVETSAAGAPRSLQYMDSAERPIRSYLRNFTDTDWIRTRTYFDERGLKLSEYGPYDSSKGEPTSLGIRYLSYDTLGRLTSKEVDQANGGILATTYTHDGFTTTINAGGIQMERTYNGLGQLMETRDGAWGYTRYAYDGAGNPVMMQDPKMVTMGNSVGIKAAFNALGQKTWVSDPDWWDEASSTYGTKSFTYNAVGEVLTELDPNGNLTEMTYDPLGRLTERHLNGWLRGKWHYDNPSPHKGLGLLDFEDSQFGPDGSRLQKFYYYSDAASGRKDLLQVTHRLYENFDPNDYEEYDTQFFTDGFYARPKGLRFPGGASVQYLYSAQGHLSEERDPLSGVVYRQITEVSSRGQVRNANVGFHGGSYQYSLSAQPYAATGQLQTITVSNGTANVLDLAYTYDIHGNLQTRTRDGTQTETLWYDDLQRLTSTDRPFAGGGTVSYGYDAAGNFLSKSDYADSYDYHPSRPHVLTAIAQGSTSTEFETDANGNLTARGTDRLYYTAFNKPERIENGPSVTQISYGADFSRYRQVTPSGSRIYYLDKLMEIETAGASADYRHYLGEVAVLTKMDALSDPNPSIRYLFRDRLGSVAAIGDEGGTLIEARGYDPFGKPRNGDWTDKTPAELNSATTDRGFTDHEHLDAWGLIHMNGRGYDYELGRFLSIDPVIQSPGNSQSINPYIYILNNPLSGTDPTGYESEPADDKEVTVKVRHHGSRIKSKVKVSSTGTDKMHVEGSNGAAEWAVANHIGESFKGGAGFEFKIDEFGGVGGSKGNSGALSLPIAMMGMLSATPSQTDSSGANGPNEASLDEIELFDFADDAPLAQALLDDYEFLKSLRLGRASTISYIARKARDDPLDPESAPVERDKQEAGVIFRKSMGGYTISEPHRVVASGGAVDNVLGRIWGASTYGGHAWQLTPGDIAVYAHFPSNVKFDIDAIRQSFLRNNYRRPVFLGQGRDVYVIEGNAGPYKLFEFDRWK